MKYFLIIFFSFLVGGFGNAQTIEFDNILDAKQIQDIKIDDKTGTTTKTNLIMYSYKNGIAENQNNIINEKIEKTAKKKYKINIAPKYIKENGEWIKVDYKIETIENFKKLIPETETKFQDLLNIENANAEETFYTDTGDGAIYVMGSDWATIRASGVGTVETTAIYIGLQYYGGSSKYLNRGFIPFDLTGKPSGTITNAKLVMHTKDQSASTTINILQSTQPSMSSLGTDDFDTCDMTNGTRLSDDQNITTNDTNYEFQINQTGIDLMTGTNLKLCIRDITDIDNELRNLTGYTAFEIHGVADAPYLELTIEEEETGTSSQIIIFGGNLIDYNFAKWYIWYFFNIIFGFCILSFFGFLAKKIFKIF